MLYLMRKGMVRPQDCADAADQRCPLRASCTSSPGRIDSHIDEEDLWLK